MTREYGPTTRRPFWLPFLLLCFGVYATAGCGAKLVLVPVTGKVTVDGVPLSGGEVTLAPESSNDPPIRVIPMGKIGRDGTYDLTTAGKKGAPLGRYRAMVTAEEDPTKKRAPGAAGPFADKYTRSNKSPLEITVVASPAPGAYDLKLTK
jgi:hypothetical protein